MEKARGKGRADVAFNLGALYADQGDVRRARELWEEARSRGHAGAAANLGVLHEGTREGRGAGRRGQGPAVLRGGPRQGARG